MQKHHENTSRKIQHTTWQVTSPLPTLENHIIHVWWVNLDALANQTHRLTLDELQNANKMRFPSLRQRTINARGFLRYLLSHYLQQAPLAIVLKTAQYGKPYLDSEVPLFFNLAHSHNMAVYAFNYHDAIGVDIEKEKDLSDLTAIAQTVFSPTERRYLHNENAQTTLQTRFFTLWSRKEAIIKVTGDGLHAPLSTITTTLADGRINRQRDYASNFHLDDLPTIDNFQSAICGKLTQKTIRYYKNANL